MENKKIFISSIIAIIAVIAFAFLIFLGGSEISNNQNGGNNEGGMSPFDEPDFFSQVLQEGITSGEVKAGNFIYKDRESLVEFWDNINFSRPHVDLPEIDFEKNYVIASVSKEKPTSGYYLRLGHIKEEADDIKVYLEENSPGENCVNSQIITQPFVLYIVEATDEEFSFTTETSVTDCLF